MSAASKVNTIKAGHGENAASAWLAIEALAAEIDALRAEAPKLGADEAGRQMSRHLRGM